MGTRASRLVILLGFVIAVEASGGCKIGWYMRKISTSPFASNSGMHAGSCVLSDIESINYGHLCLFLGRGCLVLARAWAFGQPGPGRQRSRRARLDGLVWVCATRGASVAVVSCRGAARERGEKASWPRVLVALHACVCETPRPPTSVYSARGRISRAFLSQPSATPTPFCRPNPVPRAHSISTSAPNPTTPNPPPARRASTPPGCRARTCDTLS